MELFKKTNLKVVCMCFAILFTVNVYGQFAGGSGTADDPYLVETVGHLDSIRDYQNNHFRQIADIDLNESQYDDSGNWEPIPSFDGVYDGFGYEIANLHIDRPEGVSLGLIGYSSFDGAIIRNVNLIGVNITGLTNAGGLIGAASNTVIENVLVSGVVEVAHKAGGIAGHLSDSRVEDSHSDVDVSGGGDYLSGTGGIASSVWTSTIKRSLNTGSVSGVVSAGGIAGEVLSSSMIEDCYSTGSVRGRYDTGGLIGALGTDSRVKNCYSSGAVRGIYNAGGLIGTVRDKENVVNSFWNRQTSGQESSAAGTPLDITCMTGIETFTDASWDFDEIWDIENGRTFPYLRWEEEAGGHTMIKPLNLTAYPFVEEVSLEWEGYPDAIKYNIYRNRQKVANVTATEYIDTGLTNFEEYIYHVTAVYDEGETSKSNFALATPNPGFSSGEGTAEIPYSVGQPEELDYVRFYENVHFKQTADIDLADLPQNEAGNWEPVGCLQYPFKGNYDGNGYNISNLMIYGEGAYNQGFFGYVRNTYLANINLKNVDVLGHIAVGSLAGRVESSLIDNCSSDGKVVATTNYVGGLVGDSIHSTIITNSHTSGKVFLSRPSEKMTDSSTSLNKGKEDQQTSGQLLSPSGSVENHNKDVLITNPEAINTRRKLEYKPLLDAETLSGQGHCAGGLVGFNRREAKILNCFSTAEVSGEYRVGGLVGENSDGGIIANSYSTGNVTGSWSVGGLVGVNSGHSEYFGYDEGGVYSCYSTGRVTGSTYYAGLVAQGSTDYVHNSYWNTETSECDNSAGGKPRNTEQMTYPYDAETFVGWDFDEVWAADAVYEINDGYPYLREDASVSVEEDDVAAAAVANTVELKVYPNPFNPNAVIAFNLSQRTTVKISIYNIRGQLVKMLTNNEYQAGEHKVTWNGTDDRGTSQPSGVYFTKIETPEYRQAKKIMLLK